MVAVSGFGLDVGASKTLGVVVAADGRVVSQVQRPTSSGTDGVVDTVRAVVGELRARSGLQPRGPVGVGVPGLVDPADGTLRHAVNLGVNGERHPLGQLLASALGHPVVLENDVKAATLGMSAVSGERDLALLSIGTGLAAGVVLDGRLRRGARGAAGEIGHLPVVPDGRTCSCGQRGCLETVASGSALATAWPVHDGFAGKALFAAAAAGDTRAVAAVQDFTGGLATAVRLLVMAVDVDCVALGGGVAHVGAPLLDAVRTRLSSGEGSSPFLDSLDVPGRVCLVPDDAPVAAIGAAMLGHG